MSRFIIILFFLLMCQYLFSQSEHINHDTIKNKDIIMTKLNFEWGVNLYYEDTLTNVSFIEGYYKNGQRREISYKDKNENGFVISWYPDGTIEMLAKYLNGQIYGDYILWYDNGNVKEKGNFYSNSIDSCVNSSYFTDTIIEKTIDSTYGDTITVPIHSTGFNVDGYCSFFYENGKISKEEMWKNGILIWRKEYDEEGNLIKN